MEQKIHTYESDEITVTYDVKRCIHARECVKGLREVFDPNKRPWIQPEHADPSDIMEVIERCPTGALHYRDKKSNRVEKAPTENTIRPAANGPVYIHGNVELQDENGETLLRDTRVAICRCGQSKNKPLCDNSHLEGDFHANASFNPSSLETETESQFSSGAPLVLKALKNGPVLVQGSYRMQASDGLSAVSSTNVALCRCGGSGNKPFCDGTHKKIGFESL